VAEKEGVASGYRVVINNGAEGCKEHSRNLCPHFFLISLSVSSLQMFFVFGDANGVPFVCHRPICLSSAPACTWWKADEVAPWLNYEG
jgi:hypothetical protein